MSLAPNVLDELLRDPFALVIRRDADGLEVVGCELVSGREDPLGFGTVCGQELWGGDVSDTWKKIGMISMNARIPSTISEPRALAKP